MKKFKAIINFNGVASLEEDIKFTNHHLLNHGNLYHIFKNSYDCNGNVENDILDVMDYYLKNGYYYKNIIVFPLEKSTFTNVYLDNVGYILWMSNKNKNKYFDKDPIREKHIWKDIEWGKRKKNYNSKGKDPGNVWIPTEDDGKGNITKHHLLSIEEIINRIILMSSIEKKSELKILGSWDEYKEEKHTKIKNSVFFPRRNPKTTISTDNVVYFSSSENMDDIKDRQVDFAITSPPYWNLKDYFKKGQIGQESYTSYLERLEKVFSETYDKLDDSGAFWVNINIRRSMGKVTLNPRDIITRMKRIGFYYKGIIIWHKSSGIPVNNNNLSDKFEFLFLFSKSNDYKINLNYLQKIKDYENADINGKSFWNINRRAGSIGKKFVHPAIFPLELVSRSIKLNTQKDEQVLDPFLGSGTSLVASLNNDRRFVGYEYNEDFEELIKFRVQEETDFVEKIKYIHNNFS